jgi:hypothetical protein
MKNTAGPPVIDEDFFDREMEQRLVWGKLEANNLLLLAPRRVGKTSLMLKLKKDAGEHGYRCLFFSAEDIGDETAFVRKFYEKFCDIEGCEPILDRIMKSSVGKLLKKIKKVSGGGVGVEFGELSGDDWTQLGKTLTQALNDIKEPWLIEIDEVPLFVLKLLKFSDGQKRVRAFLSWLRVLRQEHPEIRWTLAGSIGLDTVTARLNMGDTINDLQTVHLGPFTNESAQRLLESLAGSYDFILSPSVRDEIIRHVGWLLPYYLQIVFSLLRDNAPEHVEQWEPTIDMVPRIFDELLSPSNRNYFDYWRQRLSEELGTPDDRYAVILLNAACQDVVGSPRHILFQTLHAQITDPDQCGDRLRYLLDVLVNDGYLVEDDDRYRFRFGLLRDYWLRRVRI